jgi:glyoxalase family protein
MIQTNGIHHVTAITSSAEKIYQFFTFTLGLRLVKKTINQDDIHTYHLFFADDQGSPGTDMTFFDFPGSRQAVHGSDEISRTSFRVATNEALTYWVKRFDYYKVAHQPIRTLFDREWLFFEDFDGQAYALVSDEGIEGVASGIPWKKGPVPDEFAITGLGPIFLRVKDASLMDTVLVQTMGMRFLAKESSYKLYETGLGGNGASVVVDVQPLLPEAVQGYGTVHHVAFSVHEAKDLQEWMVHLNAVRKRHSGLIDRFYFKSLYSRIYPTILFEFATEGPGFIDDEEGIETLGETLALPPAFRNMRTQIEALVRPIDTVRSTLTFQKEYFNDQGDLV